jgi:hypothetical protein
MSALVPFVVGEKARAHRLAERCPLGRAEPIDVLSEGARDMFALLLAANALSYDVLSMPAWVQLDCAALPAGIIGFARPRRDLAGDLWPRFLARAPDADRARLARYEGLVPVAQYTCVPSSEAGHVVGFSLLSLERGLGRRVKACALAMHRARVQTGVAQVDNSAMRVHVGLGPLRVTAAPLAVHDLAERTIAYELAVPQRQDLERIARTGERLPAPAARERVSIGPSTAAELGAMVRERGRVEIVDVTREDLAVR